MILNLRTKDGELVSKDYLDIDFDMCVKKEKVGNEDQYVVWINDKLRFPENFDDRGSAEDQMLHIADVRNSLEEIALGWKE